MKKMLSCNLLLGRKSEQRVDFAKIPVGAQPNNLANAYLWNTSS